MSERLEAKVMLSAVVANDDSFSVLHTFPLEGVDVIGNDVDNSPFMEGLTASLISDVSHGTLTLDPGGTFQYIPSGTYVGVDSFVYEASNSYGSDQATVTITVGNIAPVADNLTFDVPHSTTLSDVSVSAANDDGGTLTFSLDGGVSAGSLVFHGSGSFTYTPPVGFVTTPGNPVAFNYIADDGFDTDTGTVSINVYNIPPEAVGDGPYGTLETFTLTVDAAEGLLANDSDFDGDAADLIVSYYTQPENGSVSVNSDGSFEYTPDADFVGSDSFEYRVQDPQGGESQLALVQLESGTLEIHHTNRNASIGDPTLFSGISVGHRVEAEAVLTGGIDAPANLTYSWTISARSVKNYQDGVVTQLTPDDLDDSSVGFYWATGGSGSISVTISDGQNSLQKSVSPDIFRPSIDFYAETSLFVFDPDVPSVKYGVITDTLAVPGIQFNSHDNLYPTTGIFGLVQLVDGTFIRRLTGAPADETLSASGLDSPGIVVDPDDWHDSPGNSFPESGYESLGMQDYFTTWLMYKPHGDGSIWVPIKRINWFYGYHAAVNAQGDWELLSNAVSENSTFYGGDTSIFPKWDETWQEDLANNDWE